jgi:PAS domain S-box-containing protein
MDITEKLNAERELAASEERFRSIIEQFPYPVTSYSPEGTCIAANAAWEMMWQDKRENIKGYNIRKDPQLIASGLSRYVEEAFGGELAISEPYHYDPGIVGQKGRKRWMIMTLYPLKNDAGELREVVLILQDISRRKEAEEKLQRSHEELRQLASHLQDIREEERANMAREVHDELGQQITCIKMDVLWLLKKINSADAGEQEKLKAIPELLDHTSRTVRKIATELRPSILDDFGLIEALEWQSSEFEKRSGTKIKFNSTVPHIEIGRSVSTALFRIYQESLTNVARHAAATEVMVNIALKEGRLVLTITDNGRGFDITRIRDGKTLGLLGMKERTLMVGGEYEISSLPGKGTTVTVIAPLQSNHDNNA